MKEDPNDVIEADKFHLTWEKGFAFFLFDGFCVWAVAPRVTHPDLMVGLSNCLGVIKNAATGSASPQEVHSCIVRSRGYYKTSGILDPRAMKLIISTFGALPEVETEEFDANLREVVLRTNPEVIMGRIWPNDKVVSFWNSRPAIMKKRRHILEFVKDMAGSEKNFRYELEDDLVDYDEFVGGSIKKSNPLFDPSKVHTMLPGLEKTQMMGTMGFMRSKPVEIGNRSAREGD